VVKDRRGAVARGGVGGTEGGVASRGHVVEGNGFVIVLVSAGVAGCAGVGSGEDAPASDGVGAGRGVGLVLGGEESSAGGCGWDCETALL
jgi:hypothetical protein